MHIILHYHFRFSPTLIHFYLFPTKCFFFPLILDFIKLCTHDFSRVTFATELSTNLVYNSIFVIDYNYICIHLLFFFTIKLSIFSRLCVTQKKSWSGQHTLRQWFSDFFGRAPLKTYKKIWLFTVLFILFFCWWPAPPPQYSCAPPGGRAPHFENHCIKV